MKVQSKDLKSRRLIGKGLSSMVYETMWEGKSYARKDFLRVPPDIFEREAAALVGLDHPNLVRTYCWAVEERSCSLVLELMGDDLLNMIRKRKQSQRKKTPGSDSASPTSHLIDLQKFIEDSKNALVGTASRSAAMPLVYPFNLEEALQIILQIAEGMKFLHDLGVVHGDLKPKNILFPSSGGVASSSLDENMACKLSDFGLVATKMTSRSLVPRQARKLEMVRWRAPELLDFREDQECESSTKLDWDSDSSTGTISVKVQQMSSEDMKRADVYGFALTCSQILTGEDPCPDLDVNELVRELSLGLRPELPPTCPPQLSDLIKLCWSERTERPSFQDILSEMKDLKASLTRTAGSVVDIEKNTIPGTSSARTDSPGIELVPENSAVSRQLSERPGGSSDLSPGLEIDQTAEVPFGHENLVIKDIQDNSKGTFALEQESTKRKQGRWRRKAFSYLGCFTPSSEEMTDFSTPRRHTAWVKRKAKDKRKMTPFAAWGKVEAGQAPQLKEALWFSFDDIKRMTNNFNDDNVIGEGGYGKVYKGIQADTGAMLAVKRAQEGSKQGASEFKKEIEVLSRVHHKNLVGLVGFCFEKSEQIVVYEYMPNGTLTDWLRGHMSKPPLDWDRRVLIALGAARGIEYLHHYANPEIIHRDVKSSNILLDKELNAKVADFGLSMLVPDVKDGSLKSTIKGTLGYLDPEYRMTSVLSTKSDVYSFGVVLLELLTGRRPVSHGRHIVWEVCSRYDRAHMAGVRELLDPPLVDTPEDELETFLKIALVCVEDSSLERPSMHEVVQQLESLVGPKAQLMPGRGSTKGARMWNRARRTPLEMSSLVSDDFEPALGQFLSGSGSQQSSFMYSGGFAPLSVQPK